MYSSLEITIIAVIQDLHPAGLQVWLCPIRVIEQPLVPQPVSTKPLQEQQAELS